MALGLYLYSGREIIITFSAQKAWLQDLGQMAPSMAVVLAQKTRL